MNTKLLISVGCFVTAGVCLGHAPAVEAQSSAQTSTWRTPATTSRGELAGESLELEQRLAALERVVGSRTESQQRIQAQVNQLRGDIDEMRGSIELHNHQLEKLLERQRELFLEIDRRAGGGGTSQGIPQTSTSPRNQVANNTVTAIEPTPTAAARPTPRASTGAMQLNTNEQDTYQNAVNLILKDRDYEKAVPAFRSFLARFPTSEFTANAHYWLGQLLYNQQNYSDAKVQFTQVANRFGDSPKRSDSLLKLGLIEKSSGNTTAANNFFQQVVSEYPNSTPARLAAQQLAN
jgi:tol-pal system protein YbgF